MLKLTTFTCSKCAHRRSNYCTLMNISVENDNFCVGYTESPYICTKCEKHLLANQVIIELNNIYCANCFEKLGTCENCRNATICAFRNDSSIQESQIVTQVIQQGGTRIQQQVKNPKRIKLTCANCKCYLNDQCMKETIQCCNSYTAQ